MDRVQNRDGLTMARREDSSRQVDPLIEAPGSSESAPSFPSALQINRRLFFPGERGPRLEAPGLNRSKRQSVEAVAQRFPRDGLASFEKDRGRRGE
jgi:hypothetical protein